MYISSISIKNFRLLQETTLILNETEKQDLTLIIGKNNSGKTSFIMLFDKFLRKEVNFDFNDFPINLRKQILEINEKQNIDDLVIGLIIVIKYDKKDDLEHLSEFIIDLNPKVHEVNLYFECSINKDKLLKDLHTIEIKHKSKFIEKNLSSYLSEAIYLFNNESDLLDKQKLVKKEVAEIKKIINYQVIHAKRNLSSSESVGGNNLPLSKLSSEYFNKENKFSEDKFTDINNAILKMDEDLSEAYQKHFGDYFQTVNQFLGGSSLNVISDLESRKILSNHSRIVYGVNNESYLPESLNGLGHLNILFVLLQIEVKKKFFEQESKDINLLFIEEPEAHTHPQMQYIFAEKIKDIISKIPKLQTFITTHSSHIVSQCDFKDIRYFRSRHSDGIKVKNFYNELEKKYSSEPDYFKFLKQFITLYSSELFFAEKVVFVEGISEKILLPYFIKRYDDDNKTRPDYIPIASQNISFIEAGANAKVFRHLIDFLEIKTLIITDIDTTKLNDNSRWSACAVVNGKNSSNETIKYYLGYEKNQDFNLDSWIENIKNKTIYSINKNVEVAYQSEQNGYHARSFEDAFISCNIDLISQLKNEEFLGLTGKEAIISTRTDFYNLTDEILDSKSEFASFILYLALTKDIKWNTPNYISNALKWISE